MSVTSVTWDRFAVGASVLFGFACLGALLPIWIDVGDFPVPPAIALVAFGPLFLAWVTAIRPTITVDDQGIRGLTWGNALVPWARIKSAEITGGLLQVVPRDAGTYAWSPQMLRLRPGIKNDALAAKLDPHTTDAVAAAIGRHLAPPHITG